MIRRHHSPSSMSGFTFAPKRMSVFGSSVEPIDSATHMTRNVTNMSA
ncbi:hypothetical protein [Exiguobacterium mexicanum]